MIDTFSPAHVDPAQRHCVEALNRYHIPGVVVFVSAPGEGMWEGAYGRV